jgi:hypothetical protein
MLVGGLTTTLVALILTGLNHFQVERIQDIATAETIILAHAGMNEKF